ncbi:hypothetical protein ABK040_016404 [Willaertia magna]
MIDTSESDVVSSNSSSSSSSSDSEEELNIVDEPTTITNSCTNSTLSSPTIEKKDFSNNSSSFSSSEMIQQQFTTISNNNNTDNNNNLQENKKEENRKEQQLEKEEKEEEMKEIFTPIHLLETLQGISSTSSFPSSSSSFNEINITNKINNERNTENVGNIGNELNDIINSIDFQRPKLLSPLSSKELFLEINNVSNFYEQQFQNCCNGNSLQNNSLQNNSLQNNSLQNNLNVENDKKIMIDFNYVQGLSNYLPNIEIIKNNNQQQDENLTNLENDKKKEEEEGFNWLNFKLKDNLINRYQPFLSFSIFKNILKEEEQNNPLEINNKRRIMEEEELNNYLEMTSSFGMENDNIKRINFYNEILKKSGFKITLDKNNKNDNNDYNNKNDEKNDNNNSEIMMNSNNTNIITNIDTTMIDKDQQQKQEQKQERIIIEREELINFKDVEMKSTLSNNDNDNTEMKNIMEEEKLNSSLQKEINKEERKEEEEERNHLYFDDEIGGLSEHYDLFSSPLKEQFSNSMNNTLINNNNHNTINSNTTISNTTTNEHNNNDINGKKTKIINKEKRNAIKKVKSVSSSSFINNNNNSGIAVVGSGNMLKSSRVQAIISQQQSQQESQEIQSLTNTTTNSTTTNTTNTTTNNSTNNSTNTRLPFVPLLQNSTTTTTNTIPTISTTIAINDNNNNSATATVTITAFNEKNNISHETTNLQLQPPIPPIHPMVFGQPKSLQSSNITKSQQQNNQQEKKRKKNKKKKTKNTKNLDLKNPLFHLGKYSTLTLKDHDFYIKHFKQYLSFQFSNSSGTNNNNNTSIIGIGNGSSILSSGGISSPPPYFYKVKRIIEEEQLIYCKLLFEDTLKKMQAKYFHIDSFIFEQVERMKLRKKRERIPFLNNLSIYGSAVNNEEDNGEVVVLPKHFELIRTLNNLHLQQSQMIIIGNLNNNNERLVVEPILKFSKLIYQTTEKCFTIQREKLLHETISVPLNDNNEDILLNSNSVMMEDEENEENVIHNNDKEEGSVSNNNATTTVIKHPKLPKIPINECCYLIDDPQATTLALTNISIETTTTTNNNNTDNTSIDNNNITKVYDPTTNSSRQTNNSINNNNGGNINSSSQQQHWFSNHPPLYFKRKIPLVSQDPIIQQTILPQLKSESIDAIFSTSSLTSLIDTLNPNFNEEWCIPIVVKPKVTLSDHYDSNNNAIHTNTNINSGSISSSSGSGGHTFYFDKPLIKKVWSKRDNNQLYYKYVLKSVSLDEPYITYHCKSQIPIMKFDNTINDNYNSGDYNNNDNNEVLEMMHRDGEPITYQLFTLGNYKLLIRTKHDGVIVDPQTERSVLSKIITKLEYQTEKGLEIITQNEYAKWWINSFIRPNCNLLLCHVDLQQNQVFRTDIKRVKDFLPPQQDANEIDIVDERYWSKVLTTSTASGHVGGNVVNSSQIGLIDMNVGFQPQLSVRLLYGILQELNQLIKTNYLHLFEYKSNIQLLLQKNANEPYIHILIEYIKLPPTATNSGISGNNQQKKFYYDLYTDYENAGMTDNNRMSYIPIAWKIKKQVPYTFPVEQVASQLASSSSNKNVGGAGQHRQGGKKQKRKNQENNRRKKKTKE